MKITFNIFLIVCCLQGLSGCTSDDDDDSQAVIAPVDEGDPDESGTDESGTDESGADESSAESEVVSSCEMVDVSMLQNTGGIFSTVLPADLSIPGSLIDLNDTSLDQFISFDSSTGAIEFVPQGSRLSNLVQYEVSDEEGNVLSTHSHRWVFSPVRVMPLGDSITSGVEFFDGGMDLPPRDERVGYRKFLFDELSANGIVIDYFGQGGQAAGAAAGLSDPENNGYPGVDIDFIGGKLIELLTEDTVDIILLHIGTNNTPSNAQGIDDLLDTLDEWETANQPVLVMVATLVPKRDLSLNAIVEQFNEDLVNRISARNDDLVVLVDQNSVVTVDDISTEQIGLHPSSLGYEKMANAWFDALTAESSDALYTCP